MFFDKIYIYTVYADNFQHLMQYRFFGDAVVRSSSSAYLKNFMFCCHMYTSKIKVIQLLFYLAVFMWCMVILMGNVQCDTNKLLASGMRRKYCSDNWETHVDLYFYISEAAISWIGVFL